MPTKRRPIRRLGSSTQILMLFVAVSVVLPLAMWALLEKWQSNDVESGPLTCLPRRATFVHEITGKGTIECASNVEVKAEADAIGFHATTILEIVPEGTYVEPGDFLMQLDSSPLKELLLARTIEANGMEASLIKAETNLATSRIRLEEYIDGLLPQYRQAYSNELDSAREELRKARQTLDSSRSMYRQGFVTRLAVDADQYSTERAEIDLEKAATKLRVLEEFSSKMKLKQLESALAVFEASVRSQRHTYGLAVEELKHIEEQIGKCLITAPASGNVVYANLKWDNQSYPIETGAVVWEHRVVFKLPNSDQMQVKIRVREENVALVAPGQNVRIHCESYPGVELTGRVERVEQYAAPNDRWSPDIKAYETTISIDPESVTASSVELRPGLTAEVFVEVRRRDDQLMVPFHAVLKHGEKHYSLTHDRRGFHAREVQVGASNGNFVVVSKGLGDDQRVVLGAANYRQEVELPEL